MPRSLPTALLLLAITAAARAWRSLVISDGTGDLRTRYQETQRFLRGDIAPDELDPLINQAIEDISPLLITSTGRPLMTPVEQFHQQHHDDWALKLVTAAVAATRDPGYWALMGDIEMDNHHWKPAADYYQKAAVLNLTDGSLAYRMGLALSRDPATKTAGDQLMTLAPFLVLADLDQAQALANAMRKFQGDDVADAWFESYTRRYSRMELDNLGDSIVIARDAAEKKGAIAQAFELQKKLMFSPPYPRSGNYNVPVTQMLNWAHFYRLQALLALGQKDAATTAAALQGELNNGPPDVPLLEQTWPLVKQNPAAQNTLQSATARLQAIVEDYPEATKYADELHRLQTLQQQK